MGHDPPQSAAEPAGPLRSEPPRGNDLNEPRANAMDEAPRYATLRDYLQVLRRRRVLIAVVTAVFAGAALLISVAQTPVYQASASLTFRDIFQDLRLIGSGDTVPDVPPGVR